MICPHCNKDIEFVMCVSSYTQRQMLDKNGVLLAEWEDINDCMGDTLYHHCPECYQNLNFDNDGILVE